MNDDEVVVSVRCVQEASASRSRRPSRPAASFVMIALIGLISSGCTLAAGLRASVGPTLDTQGIPGVEGTLAMSLGAAETRDVERRRFLLENIRFGAVGSRGAPEISGTLGLEALGPTLYGGGAVGFRSVLQRQQEEGFARQLSLEASFGVAPLNLQGKPTATRTVGRGGVGLDCAVRPGALHGRCTLALTGWILYTDAVKQPGHLFLDL